MNNFFRSVISKIKEIAMSEDAGEESAPTPCSNAAKENTQPVRPAAAAPTKQEKSMYKSVIGKSTMYFWDPAGKFDAVKDEAHKRCCGECDLTIYSLTPKGKTEPTRLIVKATPAGNPKSYLSGQSGVAMCTLNYHAIPADALKDVCHYLERQLSFHLLSENYYVVFKKCNEMFHKYGRGNDMYFVIPIDLDDFFGADPREDEPGAQIYLSDKEFFLPSQFNPAKPDFSKMMLLTDDQKANVAAIDLSYTDVSSRNSLNKLFKGYKKISRLDLSSFDTSRVQEMEEMFFGCENLRLLDLSTFDFRRVKYMNNMFGQCRNLEEVIFSDTVRSAGEIPRETGGYMEVSLPFLADSPYSRDHDHHIVPEKSYVCFGTASDRELRQYLGLNDSTKITIVPHRALKK